MNSKALRQKFLDFFEKRGHKIVPSSSLVPEDPTVLLTSAGMQQFFLYLAGKKDPTGDFGTQYLVSCQKCFRTGDIEEVGDDTHHTFFEMLGNWSIGQDKEGKYFKEGAIRYALEFFIDILHLSKDRFFITIFKGNKSIPRDKESFKIWQENGIQKERIREFKEDNFWGPVGDAGPCGPSSEIHYDRGEEFGCGNPDCGPNCPRCHRFVELWNLVFMEYYRNVKCQISNVKTYEYVLLPQKNVDTGIGFERLVAVLQQKPSAYETDLFLPIIEKLEELSGIKYKKKEKEFRIIADHIRGTVFLISEGILPSNLDRGYILRRVLRRAIRYAKLLKLKEKWYIEPVKKIVEIYGDIYPEIKANEERIITVIQNEEEKFGKTLEAGLKELHKIFYWLQEIQKAKDVILERKRVPINLLENAKKLGKKLFFIYQSYGFPIELSLEEFETYFGEPIFFKEEVKRSFYEEIKKHQEISRAGAEKKFGGGGEFSPKLHTATHLLHSALRKILGSEVKQMGSDITKERLRFDFSFNRKMTNEEIRKVEDLVNQKIKENLEVRKEEMKLENALKSGALFVEKKWAVGGWRPEEVMVYTIFSPKTEEIFSREICAGPHVKSLKGLGKFKIKKEESSGSGVRRIKAVLL